MTICIAAACDEGRFAVTATDGQLTFADITADVMIGKQGWFDDWQCMYAGEPANSQMVFEEMYAIHKSEPLTRENIKSVMLRVYRRRMADCLSAAVLSPYDLSMNHWLIDRGDGVPSVNLVVLSFVDPLKLMNKTNDAQTINGVPIGMNQQVVSYFTGHNVRVMLSIGGITFVSNWNTALSTNPTQLGLNAAALARSLGVGIEIDYEESTTPNLNGLQAFINAYRSQLPYDATGANPAARLTIDVAAGDRFLIDLDRKATSDWLTTANPVLDYANAMVPNKQPTNAASAEGNWQEHVDGKSNFAPPILPLAPAKFTGSLYITSGHNPLPECTTFSSSLEDSTGSYVQTVAPNGAGTTSGMLGYMFWAAECPSTRNICTTPPNTCQGGVGTGARTYNIALPMPPLRQQ